jgi:hypothetical protein
MSGGICQGSMLDITREKEKVMGAKGKKKIYVPTRAEGIVLSVMDIMVLTKILLTPGCYFSMNGIPFIEKESITYLEEHQLIDTTDEWVAPEDSDEDDDCDDSEGEFYKVTEKGEIYLDALTKVKLPIPTTVWAIPKE